MQEITENRIGVSEMLVASGVAGIIYGSLAVQPLVILALTGPVLVFEEAVFHVGTTSVTCCSGSNHVHIVLE